MIWSPWACWSWFKAYSFREWYHQIFLLVHKDHKWMLLWSFSDLFCLIYVSIYFYFDSDCKSWHTHGKLSHGTKKKAKYRVNEGQEQTEHMPELEMLSEGPMKQYKWGKLGLWNFTIQHTSRKTCETLEVIFCHEENSSKQFVLVPRENLCPAITHKDWEVSICYSGIWFYFMKLDATREINLLLPR